MAASVDTRMGTTNVGATAATAPLIAAATNVPMRVLLRNLGGVAIRVGDVPSSDNAVSMLYTLPAGASDVLLLAPEQDLYAIGAAAGGVLSFVKTPLDAHWKTDGVSQLGPSRMSTVVFVAPNASPNPKRLTQARERPVRVMIRNTSAALLIVGVEQGDLVFRDNNFTRTFAYAIPAGAADVLLLMPGQTLYGITNAGAIISLEENEGMLLTDNVLLL